MSDIRVRFQGDAKGAVLASKQVEASLSSLDKQAGRTHSRLEGMAGAIAGKALVGATVGLGLLGAAVGVAGFKFDALREQALTAFTTMLGSGEKAKAFLDDLADFAAKTPFEFPDLIRASQRMLAMGFAAQDIKPTLTAVGDAVAAIGGDPAAMDATIRALGQIQAKGRVMAEEMMQLNEAGTFSWKNLADAIGVSVPKAMELVSKGAVSSEQFMKAFIDNTEQRLGGMMDKQSHSFNGLLSTIRDTFSRISGQVMLPFFEDATSGMQKLVDFTSGPEFTAGVERFAGFMRNEVSPAIKDGIGWLIDHRGQIVGTLSDAADFAMGMAEGVRSIHKAVAPLVDAIGGWETVAKAAFGAAMLSRITALTFALVGGGAVAGAAGGAAATGGLRGALMLLTRSPWLIPLTIGVTFKGDLAETQIGKWWNDAWEPILKQMERIPGMEGQLLKDVPVKVPATQVPGPTEGTRGARAPGNLLQAPTTWAGTHVTDNLDWNKGQKTAVDIMATAGTPIGAPENGVVVRHGGAQGGEALYFQGDSGYLYWMGHVSQMAPVGARLKKGQVIAYVANQNVSAPHLHIDKKQTVVAPSAAAATTPGATGAGGGTGTGKAGPDKPTAADAAEVTATMGLLAFIGKAIPKALDTTEPELRKRLAGIRKALKDARLDDVITDAELSKIRSQAEKLNKELGRSIRVDQIRDSLAGAREQITELFAGGFITAQARDSLKAQISQVARLIHQALGADSDEGMKISAKEAAAIEKSWDAVSGKIAKGIKAAAEAAAGVAKVKAAFKTALKDGLISDDELAAVVKGLDGLKGRIVAGIRGAAQAALDARPAFTAAWDRFVGFALETFDRARAKLREKLQATVTFEGITFKFGAGDLTPTERLLADMDKAAKEAQLQAAVDAAETEEARAQALLEQRRYFLEQQAGLERKAADEALAVTQAEFDFKTAQRRQAFETELADIGAQMAGGKLSYEQGLQKIKGLFASYQVPFGSQGAALGNALQLALMGALGQLETAMNRLAGALETLVKRMGGQVAEARRLAAQLPTVANPGGQNYILNPDGTIAPGQPPRTGQQQFWQGGIAYVGGAARGMRIPGSFMPTDSLIAAVSPGEMILNDRQQARLFALANGRAGASGSDTPSVYMTVKGSIFTEHDIVDAVLKALGQRTAFSGDLGFG